METDEFGTVFVLFSSRKGCELENEFRYGRGRVQ